MYGGHSHLGLAADKIDAQIFGKSSPPPSPPRLHLCEGGDGNYTKCNICTGEMAEGLLQIYITVNKSSICPSDKSCSKGRARGHQMRVTSCNCCCHPRRGAPGLQQDGGQGRLGGAKNLSLLFSSDCPSMSLTASRTAKFPAMLWLSVPKAPRSCYALLHLHLQVPALLNHLCGPVNSNSTKLSKKYAWNTCFTSKHSTGVYLFPFLLSQPVPP